MQAADYNPYCRNYYGSKRGSHWHILQRNSSMYYILWCVNKFDQFKYKILKWVARYTLACQSKVYVWKTLYLRFLFNSMPFSVSLHSASNRGVSGSRWDLTIWTCWVNKRAWELTLDSTERQSQVLFLCGLSASHRPLWLQGAWVDSPNIFEQWRLPPNWLTQMFCVQR